MPEPLATQPVIAFVWDFDRTLIPGTTLSAVLTAHGVDEDRFNEEVAGLVDHHASRGETVSAHHACLAHLLAYVRAGMLPGLDNAGLRAVGADLEPAPGMPEFLEATRRRVTEIPELAREGLVVEHHVLSTGLRAVIEGSSLAAHLDGIWASTFVEAHPPPGYPDQLPVGDASDSIVDVGLPFDATAKTRAIFEINKGVPVDPTIDVDIPMGLAQRRVPLRHMIAVSDGSTAVPVFSILNANGGSAFGVHTGDNEDEVRRLLDQGRVHGVAAADYREGSEAHEWLTETLEQLGYEIAENRRQAFAAHTPGTGGR